MHSSGQHVAELLRDVTVDGTTGGVGHRSLFLSRVVDDGCKGLGIWLKLQTHRGLQFFMYRIQG